MGKGSKPREQGARPDHHDNIDWSSPKLPNPKVGDIITYKKDGKKIKAVCVAKG
ncbi:MAG: hypothetical protein KAS32_25020 [Candidatus Peribacteraceae bacterium]|nr:hypothetical protein [Candidatus Peribacteraceae bacterium]